MIKGRMKYVPPNILDEINNIKTEENVSKDSEAFRRLVDYSRVGREVKKMRDRLFLKDIFNEQKQKK